jgi:arylsulfatase A-like enzyme
MSGPTFSVITAVLTLLGSVPTSAAAARPHIVVVLADDLGLGDVGCYGGTVAPTPNIDRLAREGTRFTQYYAAAPICSPSRCGILTGTFPARWRITSFLQTRAGNRGCGQADYLDPQAPSLPRALKAAGYRTAHFGKWHLGGGRDVYDPPRFAAYGYDEHAGTWESPQPHPDITAGCSSVSMTSNRSSAATATGPSGRRTSTGWPPAASASNAPTATRRCVPRRGTPS